VTALALPDARRGGARRRLQLQPWRLPLLMLLAAAVALVAALVLVDRIGERIIEEESRAAVAAEQSYLSALAREEGLQALVDTLNKRDRLQGGGFRYSLTDAHGAPLAGAPVMGVDGGDTGAWKVQEVREDGRSTRWQVVATALPSGQRLLVAQNLDLRRAFRAAVVRSSALAILLAAGASVAVGMAFNTLLLARAKSIADTAARIASGDLQARVETHAPGDVFDRLGTSINLMLSRIEELMTGLRTVTDSLAHDLRTPLTRLKGALARALAPGLDEAARIAAVEQAHAEVDRTLATFSALLDIAQAEAGLSRETMATVDMAALVADLAELFGPMLEDAGQSLELVLPYRPVRLRGHELLLRQALGNLLHNASRYCGPGATVVLSMELVGRQISVVVADDGPGVPAEDRERVQGRFVRLDNARSTGGSGLGLAIVAACAKLHDGALTLEDNEPGLRAIITLSC
jgi:signal transduction histidine kinase